MTSKLTVYVDDSLRRLLRESADSRSLSDVVSDAIESYLSQSLASNIAQEAEWTELPSITRVVKERPKARGSSAEIIANQRRGRNARIS